MYKIIKISLKKDNSVYSKSEEKKLFNITRVLITFECKQQNNSCICIYVCIYA